MLGWLAWHWIGLEPVSTGDSLETEPAGTDMRTSPSGINLGLGAAVSSTALKILGVRMVRGQRNKNKRQHTES